MTLLMKGIGAAAVLWLLLRMAAEDIRRERIPHTYSLFLLLFGILAGRKDPAGLAAGLSGGLLLLAAGAVLYRLAGSYSLGGGDLKWIAASAVCLGFWGALKALLAACILVLLVRGSQGCRAKEGHRFPFGPYLSAATGFFLLLRYF